MTRSSRPAPLIGAAAQRATHRSPLRTPQSGTRGSTG
jgi:hypothetical protein